MTKNGKTNGKTNSPKLANITPYKLNEFEKFIDLLRGESVFYWSQIANTLGVSRETISIWKNTPQAQKAIRDGIENALDGMTKAGSDDWRMWESKLKMLGLSPIEKSDITTGGKEFPTPIYGGKSTTPVQD